ncbi:MAG: hypothetical protein KGL39_12345 [Patescibacteria group bacterium]|nr:hypothetical protein [Patescibacteria group bacterium]
MANNQLCVMDSIRARRGLCTKLAKHLKVDRRIIWQWHRVPIRHALKTSRLTGIPVKIIKGEHARNWPVPLIEVAQRAGYTIGKKISSDNNGIPEPASSQQSLGSPLTKPSIYTELQKLSA